MCNGKVQPLKQSEREDEKFPPCGYGLLGLCCSACLLGPCRLSPFESEPPGGLCGDSRDLIVAKSLLRLATREAANQISRLKETVLERGKKEGRGHLPGKGLATSEKKTLAQKYGLASNRSAGQWVRSLMKESTNLLSLFSETTSPIVLSLYPERVFPLLYGGKLPFGSVTSLLLESMNDRNGPSTVEDILGQCLQVSMITVLSEELRRDINDLVDGISPPGNDRQALDALNDLPPDPVPLLVILTQDEDDQIVYEWEESFKGKGLMLSIRGIASLPEIGRRLFEKWSVSVTEMEALVFVTSPLATWVLGALALGFTVVSSPSLPIHGSERAEKFFNKYSPSRDRLPEFLKGKA